MNNHSMQNTEEEPIALETTAAAPAAHRRYTFHRRLQPLYTEKHKVSCSRLLPNTSPMQHPCSHYIAICHQRCNKRIESRTHEQPLDAEHRGGGTFNRRLQPHYTEKHKFSCSGFLPNSSPMQHSCSHYIAICHQRCNKRIESRTHEQPLDAEHRGRTDRARNDRSRKHKVSCSRLLPNTSPMQHSCSHYIAICNQRCNKRIESRTHEQPLDAEHREGTDRARNHRSRTRLNRTYLSSPHATTLSGKHKVTCAGFLPNSSPMQNYSCHYIAICNQRCNKHKESRTHEQPLRGGTDRARTTPAAPAAHTRYLSSPAAATLYGKAQGFISRFLQKRNPCNIHAAIPMCFATSSHTTLH